MAFSTRENKGDKSEEPHVQKVGHILAGIPARISVRVQSPVWVMSGPVIGYVIHQQGASDPRKSLQEPREIDRELGFTYGFLRLPENHAFLVDELDGAPARDIRPTRLVRFCLVADISALAFGRIPAISRGIVCR